MHNVLRGHIEKIVSLSDEEFSFISSHFGIQQYKKGQAIFREGARVRYAYFVISGLLMLTLKDDSGREHVVSFAMEDWWESDFQAYYMQTSASMSLQCLEDTQVLCISLQQYKQLCAGSQKMQHFFLEKANGGHIGSQQRILSLITSNASKRYYQLVNRYPSLVQRVPKTLLASYLGVSRETLSRLS